MNQCQKKNLRLEKNDMQTHRIKTRNYRNHFKRIKYNAYVRDTALLSEQLKRGAIPLNLGKRIFDDIAREIREKSKEP